MPSPVQEQQVAAGHWTRPRASLMRRSRAGSERREAHPPAVTVQADSLSGTKVRKVNRWPLGGVVAINQH